MTTREQKWFIEKLGGCWHNPQKAIRSFQDGFSHTAYTTRCTKCKEWCPKQVNPITPNGYEWVRQRMCELGLWDELDKWLWSTDNPILRFTAAWEFLSPAEKSKLIYDFLKERE